MLFHLLFFIFLIMSDVTYNIKIFIVLNKIKTGFVYLMLILIMSDSSNAFC